MISAPAGLVIIQTDRRQPVISGAIQLYIGLGLCRFPFLLQYLAGYFICMDDIPLQQMLVQLFIHRLHIIYAAFDDPVSQCRPGKLHSSLSPGGKAGRCSHISGTSRKGETESHKKKHYRGYFATILHHRFDFNLVIIVPD